MFSTITTLPSGSTVHTYTVIRSFVVQLSVTWIHGSITFAVQPLPLFALLPTLMSCAAGQITTGAVLSVTLIT